MDSGTVNYQSGNIFLAVKGVRIFSSSVECLYFERSRVDDPTPKTRSAAFFHAECTPVLAD